MKTTFSFYDRWILAMALACCWLMPTLNAAQDDGFESIFDGRSLDGWQGQDMSFWSVEDGAITGSISPARAPRMNQYLIWQREMVQDFELKLEFRFTGCSAKNENGGFQFRSRRLPNGDVAGYQVDNNFGMPWRVRLYDEHGRHDLALEGERTVFDSRGIKHTEKLALEPGASDFRLTDWHEYHLVARGPSLVLHINGKKVAEVLDQDAANFEPAGVLAMQLHTGPPMKVQFRNIRYKRLPDTRQLTEREKSLMAAALHWTLGDRIESQQPPVRAVGTVVTETPADPTALPSDSAAEFENACLNSDMALNDSKTWNVVGQGLTVFLRARVPDGNWTSALFTKGAQVENTNFNLSGGIRDDVRGPEISFRIHTEAGSFSVSFPVAAVDARVWHDLVGRYDGRSLQLFCDAKLMAQTPASGSLTANAEPLLIGGEMHRGELRRKFTGQMREAALWDRALPEEAIRTLSLGRDRSASSDPSVTSSNWQGYQRLDFRLGNRTCLLVIPKNPAAGRPWIWRTEFFGHEPQADVALLGKGFHVAYIDVQNLYGAPVALDAMDQFHQHLTTKYGLSTRTVLEGFSRGGLFAFNWAARHPEWIACLYVDAPVCDFKSWPAGWGAGPVAARLGALQRGVWPDRRECPDVPVQPGG
jgi:hypothetical protein